MAVVLLMVLMRAVRHHRRMVVPRGRARHVWILVRVAGQTVVFVVSASSGSAIVVLACC